MLHSSQILQNQMVSSEETLQTPVVNTSNNNNKISKHHTHNKIIIMNCNNQSHKLETLRKCPPGILKIC